MTNVASEVTPVNDPLERVIDWVEKQSAKADMGGSSARLRITSLRSLSELVAEDEPKDAAWMFNNIDRLRERWARKNPGSQSDTAKTYGARARSTLSEYFRWYAAPDQYDPKPSPKREDGAKKNRTFKLPPHKNATAVSVSTETPPSLPPPPSVSDREFDRVRLGGGRELLYKTPSDGLFVKDAIRAAYALILACEDYDSALTPMQVLAQALNGAPTG